MKKANLLIDQALEMTILPSNVCLNKQLPVL